MQPITHLMHFSNPMKSYIEAMMGLTNEDTLEPRLYAKQCILGLLDKFGYSSIKKGSVQ